MQARGLFFDSDLPLRGDDPAVREGWRAAPGDDGAVAHEGLNAQEEEDPTDDETVEVDDALPPQQPQSPPLPPPQGHLHSSLLLQGVVVGEDVEVEAQVAGQAAAQVAAAAVLVEEVHRQVQMAQHQAAP